MLKSLLFGLSVTTVAASAAADVSNLKALPASFSVTKSTAEAPKQSVYKKLAKGATVTIRETAASAKVKQISLPFLNIINPARHARSVAKAPEGTSFFESFEGEDLASLGWSTQSTGEFQDETTPWMIGSDELSLLGITPPDGNSIAFLNYSAESIEEWLISPDITVAADDMLGFWIYFCPGFFNSMDNVDWDTMDYTGDPVRVGDLEAYIREDGGEWVKLWSAMDNYSGRSLMELLSISDGKFSVSLSGYEGKTVQVAFKYWGTDCNAVGVDAVSVAKPSLEGISIQDPLEMTYWGTDRSADWANLNLILAQVPVMNELTWSNASDPVEGATYSWTYHNPMTNDLDVWTEGDLTATYMPDFTSDFTRRNNMYYAPVLTGSAPGASDGSYTRGYTYFQAGGKPEFEVTADEGKKLMDFGLLPYPMGLDGNTVLIIDDEQVGDPALPIFGHNVNVDKYWLNYTLNGEEPSQGDDVRLTGYCNYIAASDMPLVLTGVHTLALGKISDQANFRCDIYALNESGVIDDANIIATAYCPASAVQVSEGATNDALNIVFDFDSPVILSKATAPSYVVKISGFNSDAVSYFAPVQSELPHPQQLCYGYIEKMMRINGNEGYRQSFSPIAYTEGPHGACFNAFAINLDGYYPFISCDTEEVQLTAGEPAEISLGSYYDGADLSIEAPEGITATAAGRYDSCVLTVNATKADAQGTITVSAPGVEHKIVVKNSAAISSITASEAAIEAAYTLDGRRIAKENVPAGFYIVRRTDGTTAKAFIR